MDPIASTIRAYAPKAQAAIQSSMSKEELGERLKLLTNTYISNFFSLMDTAIPLSERHRACRQVRDVLEAINACILKQISDPYDPDFRILVVFSFE